jgi:hypothetical protein
MTIDTFFAEVSNYSGLRDSIRARVEQLGTTRTCPDEITGLPSGYCGKLLAQGEANRKRIGPLSLDLLLPAVGLTIARRRQDSARKSRADACPARRIASSAWQQLQKLQRPKEAEARCHAPAKTTNRQARPAVFEQACSLKMPRLAQRFNETGHSWVWGHRTPADKSLPIRGELKASYSAPSGG